MLQPMGLGQFVIPTREWRELCRAGLLSSRHVAPLLCRHRARVQSSWTALPGSAGWRRGTRDWLTHLGDVLNLLEANRRRGQCAAPGHPRCTGANPIDARITLSGYEGLSSLLRDCSSRAAPTCATWALPAPNGLSAHDCEGWSRGVCVKFRASLEDDPGAGCLRARYRIGTPLQHAKELSTEPVLHQFDFSPPSDGVAGAGSLAQVTGTASGKSASKQESFCGVGSGTKTGIWTPQIINRHGMGDAG